MEKLSKDKKHVIVVGVVRLDNKFLVLKRTLSQEFDPGKWEFVSGFLKQDDKETAVVEQVKYETGLHAKIIQTGETFEVADQYGVWIIHPFLLESDKRQINLNKDDHSEYKLISQEDVTNLDRVEGLEKNLVSFDL